MIKGVIFDYNATLIKDYQLNIDTWRMFYNEFLGTDEGSTEFLNTQMKNNDKYVVEQLYKKIGKIPTQEDIDRCSHRKEEFYHQVAMERQMNDVEPGAGDLLDYLISKGIKINLCTASIKYNVDFYFDYVRLDRWFDKSIVAYDNGRVPNKFEMYKEAAKNMGLDPKDCIIFEDSKRGINTAIEAGFDKFVYVNLYNHSKLELKEVICMIEDYRELDYSIFDR